MPLLYLVQILKANLYIKDIYRGASVKLTYHSLCLAVLKKSATYHLKKKRHSRNSIWRAKLKAKIEKKAIRYLGIFCKEEEKTPEDVAD